MMFLKKNNRKILTILLIFLSATLFCNVAKASTLTDFTESISSVFNFINKNIIGQVKEDFCKNYILSISNGDWEKGEFRTNLGKRICTSYSVPADTTGKITSTNIQPLNENTVVSTAGTPSTSSINSPTPYVFLPSFTTSGTDLNVNQIISLTNSERKNNDSTLVNLRENNILENIAIIRVKDMFT